MIKTKNVLIPDKENIVLDDHFGDSGFFVLLDKDENFLGFVLWTNDFGYHLETCSNGGSRAICENCSTEEDTIERFLIRYKLKYESEVKLKYIKTKE